MRVILDLDETLIANDFHDARPSPKIHVTEYEIPGYGSDQVILRPYAEKFLRWCRKNTEELYLATYSSEDRAEAVINALGIRKYFDCVFSREDFYTVEDMINHGEEPEDLFKFDGDFVLVDNLEADTIGTAVKLAYFGLDYEDAISGTCEQVSDCFILAPEYYGDPEDDFLKQLYRRLKNAKSLVAA